MSKKDVKVGMQKRHCEMFGVRHSCPKTLCSDYEVGSFEQVVENGRIMKRSVVRSVHPQDRFRGLKAVDFALENVIAVGALDTLKEGYFGAVNTSELSDSMEGTIDQVINAVDAAEAEAASAQNQTPEN